MPFTCFDEMGYKEGGHVGASFKNVFTRMSDIDFPIDG